MDYLQYSVAYDFWLFGIYCFKPCYKWITFNTYTQKVIKRLLTEVLNLVINGLPSILNRKYIDNGYIIVLNLVINGLPSILEIMKKLVMHK